MSPVLAAEELQALDEAVDRALAGDAAGELEVLGYGEISTVVRWSASGVPVAAKRLPPFASERSFTTYRDSVAQYLQRLEAAGITPLATTVQGRQQPDGSWSGYCVQPMVPADAMVPALLRRASPDEGQALLERIAGRVVAAVSPELGLDGQASNWLLESDRLRYLDVSTPLLRDERGQELLDTELFLASLPWALRGLVRWRFLSAILDKYYEPRGVVLDLLGNLHKEGLSSLAARLVERLAATEPFTPAITVAEVERYYRSDASMWTLLQRLRRADRFWQRRVRRRTYPFLLPGRIERHV